MPEIIKTIKISLLGAIFFLIANWLAMFLQIPVLNAFNLTNNWIDGYLFVAGHLIIAMLLQERLGKYLPFKF